MNSSFHHTGHNRSKMMILGVTLGGILPVLLGFLTAHLGVSVPLALIGVALASFLSVFLIRKTFVGMVSLLFFAFFSTAITREAVEVPVTVFDGIVLLTWLAVLYKNKDNNTFAFRNDLTILMFFWFVWSLLQVVNPGASIAGWLREVRASALMPLLLVPLGLLVFKRVKYLDYFLILVIGFSVLGALNGIKQQHIGLSPGERHFIDSGAYVTHILFGELRVFSFYLDAGQFGASQAQIGLMALVLAFGPFQRWKRFLLFSAAAFLLYGMLISGTRGALFALLTGAVVAVGLWGNKRIIIIGATLIVSFFCFLKYTSIGNSAYAIYRLRTALDPTDASFNVRLETQNTLNAYLQSRPFGGGLGTIGYFGGKYNPGTYLASLPPDSYWVKIWAMYGIVGFLIWFCIMMYILGRCCGIVWTTKDKRLHVKLLALTAGYAGVFFCSYGNEVMNNQPSFAIMLMSWCLIFLGPKFDREIEENKKKLN